jgi:hypothetical protein
MEYNEIEIEPVDVIFKKLFKSRGGEMLLIHIDPNADKGDGIVKICTAIDNSDSFLLETLPCIVEKILNEKSSD